MVPSQFFFLHSYHGRYVRTRVPPRYYVWYHWYYHGKYRCVVHVYQWYQWYTCTNIALSHKRLEIQALRCNGDTS